MCFFQKTWTSQQLTHVRIQGKHRLPQLPDDYYWRHSCHIPSPGKVCKSRDMQILANLIVLLGHVLSQMDEAFSGTARQRGTFLSFFICFLFNVSIFWQSFFFIRRNKLLQADSNKLLNQARPIDQFDNVHGWN